MHFLTRRSSTSNPHVARKARVPLPPPSEDDLDEVKMFEPTDAELEDLDDDGTETLVMEMAALEALFEANQGEGPAERAVSLARQALEAQNREPTTFEAHIAHAALTQVAGGRPPQVSPRLSTNPSWTTFVYETIGAAWLRWFTTGDRSAVGLLDRIRQAEPDTGHLPDGAVELLALTEWGRAIEALATDDRVNAKRHFERAIEIGSQVGSDSNPSINWTYAASFFRR